MEKDTLKIYNPQDIPFGPLSNNHLTPINIDGTIYPTVTNYIFSNLFFNPMDRLIMQTAPIKGKLYPDVEEKLKQIISDIEIRQKRKLTEEEVIQFRNAIFTEQNVKRMNIYELNNHLRYQEYFETLNSAVEKAYNARVIDLLYIKVVILFWEKAQLMIIKILMDTTLSEKLLCKSVIISKNNKNMSLNNKIKIYLTIPFMKHTKPILFF